MKAVKKVIWSFILLISILFCGCKKQAPGLSAGANDIFWVTSQGSDMPVWVKGNTASNIIILVVHGGPGEGAFNFNDYETRRLRQQYAVAYWDQRSAGSSAGNNNLKQLNLPQMVADFETVVKVLKFRYGSNTRLFLYAHSFGGLLAAAYLTKDNNQNEIKGWIDIDGAHNYPLTNFLSKKMLIDTGLSQIAKGSYVDKWQKIVQYCQTHNPRKSFNASSQIEIYAHDAEKLMNVKSSSALLSFFSPEDPGSLLANWFALFNTPTGNQFIESLQNDNYSDQLAKITIPALLLWGQYDFTVPPGVGKDAYDHIGSAYKKFVLFAHSGHRPMQGDTDAAEDEIIQFVEKFR